jgi:hypothetical protein
MTLGSYQPSTEAAFPTLVKTRDAAASQEFSLSSP